MSRRSILFIGAFLFFIQFILALIFFRERTVFTDIAYHIFRLAKDGHFAIQNNRYGAVVTQIFPLIAIKASAPLKTVMLVYSLGFVVYYAALFFACMVLKKEKHAMILMLFPLLFSAHTFYWIQSELPQGIAFMIFFFAFYERLYPKIKSSAVYKILIICMLIFLAGFHPILIFPFAFILIFKYYSDKKDHGNVRYLIGMLAIFTVALAVKSIFFKVTGYEASALGSLLNFIRLFPDYFSIPSNKRFFANCLRLYYFIPILFFLLVFYYRKRNKQKMLLVAISTLGYLLLVNVMYAFSVPVYYIENLYLPIAVFLLVPLVFDMLPRMTEKYAVILLVLIAFTGLMRIYFTNKVYTVRYKWEESFLEKNRNKKRIIDAKIFPEDTLLDTWAISYELWLLSTEKYGNTASILATDSVDAYLYYLPENKTLFMTYEKYPYEELHPPYFKMRDTSKYVVITAD